tara:strand:+ start:92 stop:430 length:339 start_codon:yes stop_codon:yes gene_type:complete
MRVNTDNNFGLIEPASSERSVLSSMFAALLNTKHIIALSAEATFGKRPKGAQFETENLENKLSAIFGEFNRQKECATSNNEAKDLFINIAYHHSEGSDTASQVIRRSLPHNI